MKDWILFEYSAVDAKVIFNGGGYESRHDSIIKLFNDAYDKSKYRIVKTDRVAIFSGDKPPSDEERKQWGCRTLCISDTRDNAKDCFPCFNFVHWKEAGISDFTATTHEIEKAGMIPPRIDKLFWIGNINTHQNRRVLFNLSKEQPHRFICNECFVVGNRRDYVSLPDHTQYRSLIDVEGNGYSGRLKFLAYCNRPLLIAERPYWDWSCSQLIEWQHYIPVDRDLSDLWERLDWVNSHPDEANNIARCCLEYAKVNITYDKAVEQAKRVVWGV